MSFPVSAGAIRRTQLRLLLTALAVSGLLLPANVRWSPITTVRAAPPTVWSLVWSDEFNGPEGAAVDSTKWTPEIGNNDGWGNNELEYYTGRTDNAFQSGGSLVIKAIKEQFNGFSVHLGTSDHQKQIFAAVWPH